MHIFLDDVRHPSGVTWVKLPDGVEWNIVRSYEQFRTLVESLEEAPTFIAFDHDLAEAHYAGDFSNPDEKTGMDCAKLLYQVCSAKGWQLPEFVVHSLNPAGRINIHYYLTQAKEYL